MLNLTNPSFDCGPFDTLASENKIAGVYICNGVQTGTLPRAAKIGLGLGVGLGVCLVAMSLGCSLRRRQIKNKLASEEQTQAENLMIDVGLDSKQMDVLAASEAPPRYELRG